MLRQITDQPCEVGDFYGYEPKTQTFYYSAKDGNATRTAVFATDLKGKTRKLSTELGSNSATFSTSMKYFINVYSNMTTPQVTTLRDNTGKVLKTLINNSKLRERVAKYNMPVKEMFTLKTADGIELNGWMMKPANFDPSKKDSLSLTTRSRPPSGSATSLMSTRSASPFGAGATVVSIPS